MFVDRYWSMAFIPYKLPWLRGFIWRAAAMGIKRLVFLSPTDLLLRVCRVEARQWKGLFCT